MKRTGTNLQQSWLYWPQNSHKLVPCWMKEQPQRKRHPMNSIPVSFSVFQNLLSRAASFWLKTSEMARFHPADGSDCKENWPAEQNQAVFCRWMIQTCICAVKQLLNADLCSAEEVLTNPALQVHWCLSKMIFFLFFYNSVGSCVNYRRRGSNRLQQSALASNQLPSRKSRWNHSLCVGGALLLTCHYTHRAYQLRSVARHSS